MVGVGVKVTCSPKLVLPLGYATTETVGVRSGKAVTTWVAVAIHPLPLVAVAVTV